MKYLTIDQYKNAITDPSSFRGFGFLSNAKIVMQGKEPFSIQGDQSIVFKFEQNDYSIIAVKCYLNYSKERAKRLNSIRDYFKKNRTNYLLDFEYYEDQIRINGENKFELPINVMKWIDHYTFGDRIQQLIKINNTIGLVRLYNSFNTMASWLLMQPFSHGDLNHNNILSKTNHSIKLVDYEQMFIPVDTFNNDSVNGNENYHHPKRKYKRINKHIDDFSILIINISLFALIKKPSLFKEFNNGSNILFTKEDFLNPHESQLLHILRQ
jgi:hypothetical protein